MGPTPGPTSRRNLSLFSDPDRDLFRRHPCSFAQAVLSIVPGRSGGEIPRAEGLAMTTSEFAATVPPTPAEWAAMADNHLRALRLAYVIANGSGLVLVGRPAKQTANVATGLGLAAQFHRAFAELCETAEKRLIDASL